jgi:hypothetical protein
VTLELTFSGELRAGDWKDLYIFLEDEVDV